MTDVNRKLDLYLTHRSALIDYAASIAGARATAEDVVQEAWLRFEHAAGGNFHNPVGYLYRIVRNLALDLARRTASEQHVPDGDEELEVLPANTPSPETQVCDSNALRIVAEALAELPARTRTAFEMHRLGGHTLQEIAGHLGISVGLAHGLVRDALTHCAERLGDDDD
ncbi:sigma-70 family RNA polymerase sigma factor [Pseudothauera nasutitermitis]|uniref:Sigma-70 family RNA polymerase sigma factor n=1 Tax=Pseudothauera nasutitermitis TaxID=2565930 RepID=A0A4S4B2U8_9RHOO|nr:sigma-70 family RNA polymerase sigma factor [Pseudothauera nasutitermitis]THF66968.1 sigma-70 family RNA polymerase sigma factor [Pseudothauera nasutitermitis]